MNKKIVSEDYQQKPNDTSKVEKDKSTKNKSNAQKILPVLIVTIISLLVVLTCVLIAYYQVNKSFKQNSHTLEGVYTSSYYSMVDNVNNLSVDLAKYNNLTTKQSKLNTMQDMNEDCSYIIAGLSVLPINQANVVAATKFFNQVAGVCQAYTKILMKGDILTQQQEGLFDEIALVVEEIKSNFNKQNAGMYDTNFNFVDAGVFDNTGMNKLSASMGDLTSESIEYPAMIFDGPFSTALETKEVKGLPGQEVSAQQAYDYLKNVVYAGRNVKIEQKDDTNGDISTYNFNILTENRTFYAQISKRGGLLMTLSGCAAAGDPIIDVNQAKEMAVAFANNIGFDSMQAVWLEQHENVAYINLAPVKNGIIMYPDLAKVKIDLTNQEIIGFEALNYALNHVEREVEYNVSEAEAETLLGFDYEIIKTSRAVIRLDSGKELACYEFMTERIDGIYFYYIDANKNEVVKTMKLVSVKGVEKLI